MELITPFLDMFRDLPAWLDHQAALLGPWLYSLLFLIIFAETGLVVTPILPGDSLLFAVGALASRPGSPIDLTWMLLLLIAAAVIGDAVNYAAGYWLGPRVFKYEDSWLLNKKHLLRTQEFYERHGGKTIILARFMPIIRTFAPFVAGIGKMEYRRFAVYNVTGAIAWVATFLVGGYLFGEMPWVKRNFTIVIVAIIIISVMPMVIEFVNSRRRRAAVPAPAPVPVEAE